MEKNQLVGCVPDDFNVRALKRCRHGGSAVQCGNVDFTGRYDLCKLAAARD
jgi:hypothetical protein